MNWPNPWEGYLHKTLISFQSLKELARKANKAKERAGLSQEELDLNQREAEIWASKLTVT